MQKVLHVVSMGTERHKISLPEAIEKKVMEFVSSSNARLIEFVVDSVVIGPEGYGHALITIKYESVEEKKQEKEVRNESKQKSK